MDGLSATYKVELIIWLDCDKDILAYLCLNWEMHK